MLTVVILRQSAPDWLRLQTSRLSYRAYPPSPAGASTLSAPCSSGLRQNRATHAALTHVVRLCSQGRGSALQPQSLDQLACPGSTWNAARPGYEAPLARVRVRARMVSGLALGRTANGSSELRRFGHLAWTAHRRHLAPPSLIATSPPETGDSATRASLVSIPCDTGKGARGLRMGAPAAEPCGRAAGLGPRACVVPHPRHI